jgi:hypothetical protein
MIPEEDRKDKDLDALDRLVDRELHLLFGRYRPKQAQANRPASDDDAAMAETDAAGPGETPRDNVVRAHPLARQPRRRTPWGSEGIFAREEEAFLVNAADWLESRPNADILLDALARRVLGGAPPATAPAPQDAGWEFEAADIATSEDGDWGDDPDMTPPEVNETEPQASGSALGPEAAGASPRRQDPPEAPDNNPAV